MIGDGILTLSILPLAFPDMDAHRNMCTFFFSLMPIVTHNLEKLRFNI
jgi:hypothetical protein